MLFVLKTYSFRSHFSVVEMYSLQEPNVSVHQLLTTEWNWLDSPAECVMLVAHPHVQLYVLLLGCSTVSQGLKLQKVASAHSVPDGSVGGQARALAHFAHGMDQL